MSSAFNIPAGWREAIAEIRNGLNDATPSAFDNSGYRDYAGIVLDAVEEELSALAAAPPVDAVQGEPVAYIDPETLARLKPGGIVVATLSGGPANRFTLPIFAASVASLAVPGEKLDELVALIAGSETDFDRGIPRFQVIRSKVRDWLDTNLAASRAGSEPVAAQAVAAPEASRRGEAVGYVTQPIKWKHRQSETVVKVTRDPQLEYGFVHPIYASPSPQDSAPIAPAAAAEPSEPVKRCSNCDDSGQVSSITGEWHGRCHCEAGRSASPLFAPDRERAASLEGMVLVPRELLQAASKSLGSFVSEEGWSQQDMDVMDSIDAVLASRSSAGEAQS